MSAWLIDILPPEAQTYVGLLAIAAALLGLLLCAAGIKIARAAVALLAGALAAAAAAWWLPALLGLAPLSSALIGFAFGALLGAIGFRILQGLTLAACLALAVAGGYYRWHVNNTSPAASAPATAQSVRASDLLIRGPLATRVGSGHGNGGQRVSDGGDVPVTDRLLERWNAIPAPDQTRIEIASLATAAAVLLLAFAFAKLTTWLVTAALGATMLLAGTELSAHVYLPQWQSFIPSRLMWYAALAILTLVGLTLQRWLFWPQNNQPKSKMARGIPDDSPPAASPKIMGKPAK